MSLYGGITASVIEAGQRKEEEKRFRIDAEYANLGRELGRDSYENGCFVKEGGVSEATILSVIAGRRKEATATELVMHSN